MEIRSLFFSQVFYGDTNRNFQSCAMIEKGRIVYDILLHPQPTVREIPVSKGITLEPVMKALEKAGDSDHEPLIIEGRVGRFSPYFLKSLGDTTCVLPPEVQLLVDYIWVPNNSEWRNTVIEHLDESAIYNLFTRTSPIEFLENP